MLSRSLKTTVLAFALLFAVAAFVGRAATQDVAQSVEPSVDEHAIDPLDRVVQQRFHDVIGFGMVRVATERTFVPETKEEKTAVRGLKRAGYEVCLFLVGRNILEEVPEKYRVSEPTFGSNNSHLMSGPVLLSRQKLQELKGLPDARALWEPSREALRTFDGGSAERYGFEASGWKVEARPVRASDESCLKCHGFTMRLTVNQNGSMSIRRDDFRNELQVGDPLGAMLYVYRKSR
jgi:hypothetical protein